MNSKQVECFISAAETLNFTETSKLLFISQPTVTHNIATLEDELGYKLFDRTNKQVSLTPAGRHLYAALKQIGSEYRNAVSRARLFGEGFESELVLGCGSSEFEEQFLPRIVREFRASHPDVYLRFEMGHIREKMALLQEEKIDLLLSTTMMNADPKRFSYTPLASYGMVCAMSASHELAGRESVGFDDLAGQSLVLLDQTCAPPEMDELQKTLEHLYRPNIISYVEDIRLSRLIMLCDMGVSVMPEFKYRELEGLVAVPFEWPRRISYGISLKKGEARTYVLDFARLVRERFQTSQ